MSIVGQISTLDRAAAFDRMEGEAFDLVVIGGGITGAGLAYEAARRGLAVALLEAADFASGTSSRSSKLIHGGLRYLAQGEIALVRESALERKVVFQLAPHLAERRWMVLPTRSRAGLLRFRAAVTAYEKLGAVEGPDLHQNWGRAELAREEPAILRERYPYACAYREYLTDDARLVLANLRAAAAAGAAMANQVPVTALDRGPGGRIDAVRARCALTGREVRVRTRAVVNAAGPWCEAVRQLVYPDAPPLLHLSKGVHVVLSAERLPVNHLLLINATDGRSIFALRRGEVTYVGTTDTTYAAGAELWPRITPEDVEYLLEPLPKYLDVEPLKIEHVTAAWAGLRPLVAQPGKKPADISRKDEILIGDSGLITVAGGKLTGYRPMAIRILEHVAEVLGERLAERAEDVPLPGGDFDGDLDRAEAALTAKYALDGRTSARLVRLYGTEAPAVVECGNEALAPGVPVLRGEVDWAVHTEAAATVEDVLYRRTRVAWFDPSLREDVVAPMADRMGELMGWSGEKAASEADRARDQMRAEMSFSDPA